MKPPVPSSAPAPAPAAAATAAAPPNGSPADGSAAQWAKAALRRLALERKEPTPANFAWAYAVEAGESEGATPPAAAVPVQDPAEPGVPATAPRQDGEALARLIEQLARGLETGGKNWTLARRRDSLNRVLASSRSDAQRLQDRLGPLIASWMEDRPDGQVGAGEKPAPAAGPTPAAGPVPTPVLDPALATAEPQPGPADPGAWPQAVGRLGRSLSAALPAPTSVASRSPLEPIGGPEAAAPPSPRPAAAEDGDPLSRALGACLERLRAATRATPEDVAELDRLCGQADQVLQHREHLLAVVTRLVDELTGSLAVLAEDDGWAQGQVQALRTHLDNGLSTRGVRSMAELLRQTRERQGQLKSERERAREALKQLIQRMLGELGSLGATTGRFHENIDRYAGVIEKADSLESLAGVVREMVEESRTVAGVVSQAQTRLNEAHERAAELTVRVERLEADLQRLSAEVATDPLTQVANRRGLMDAFTVLDAQRRRDGLPLAVGLIDIDNFKRLNDELGHAAGDTALKSLAQAVQAGLRPLDRVARFGGEEFVVLLPGLTIEAAQQALTRLQRSLSGSLFLHEQRPVFVTFSAGVTLLREGETLDAAMERADIGLYEAKRTGKNRTCIA